MKLGTVSKFQVEVFWLSYHEDVLTSHGSYW
jgi:hypothetical protein